ncbi:Rrf2 family transcriptional regulator [Mycoplasma hafezii]|uniref:Rrf2 family transcriptional regulator n=1 Tax=Mycoplasma hafezii TaxID=525886 RepID=UPI003CF3A97A
MKKSTKNTTKWVFSDYIVSLHILTYLSHKKGEVVPSSVIAKNVEVNSVRIRTIVKPYIDCGWVKAYPGRMGGYEILKDPATITLKDVLNKLHLKLINESYSSGTKKVKCKIANNIGMFFKTLLIVLNNDIEKVLAQVTVQDILKSTLEGNYDWKDAF